MKKGSLSGENISSAPFGFVVGSSCPTVRKGSSIISTQPHTTKEYENLQSGNPLPQAILREHALAQCTAQMGIVWACCDIKCEVQPLPISKDQTDIAASEGALGFASKFSLNSPTVEQMTRTSEDK